MDIFHTIIIKIASVVSAVILFVGGPMQAPVVTVVDVQENGQVTATTTVPKGYKTVSSTVVHSDPIPTPVEAIPAPTTTVIQETPTESPKTAPQTVYVPVYIIKAQEQTTTTGSVPQPQLTTNPTPIMEPKILIKSPLAGKGKLDRKYEARAEPLDELNEIYLGAVLVKPDGSIENEADMEVTATDATQNKKLEGTGNVSSFGDPNNQQYYYPFRYEFHTVGAHTITFKALGVETSVTINVEKEDTR